MEKLTKDLHGGLAVGDDVKDLRTGRMGRIAWSSSIQLAGDVLLKIADANGEWTAYVRQVEKL
jgi:hypothetical protein